MIRYNTIVKLSAEGRQNTNYDVIKNDIFKVRGKIRDRFILATLFVTNEQKHFLLPVPWNFKRSEIERV